MVDLDCLALGLAGAFFGSSGQQRSFSPFFTYLRPLHTGQVSATNTSGILSGLLMFIVWMPSAYGYAQPYDKADQGMLPFSDALRKLCICLPFVHPISIVVVMLDTAVMPVTFREVGAFVIGY